MAPALDLDMISRMGRELHPVSTGVMGEDEVCPWTLFLTMALTLLKGVIPHVPRMLPIMISDPELREKATATFQSEEFINNIEEYFVQNIKDDIQGPLNRQIIKSSETVRAAVDLLDQIVKSFTSEEGGSGNDLGTTNDKPRGLLGGLLNPHTLGQIAKFARTLYAYT